MSLCCLSLKLFELCILKINKEGSVFRIHTVHWLFIRRCRLLWPVCASQSVLDCFWQFLTFLQICFGLFWHWKLWNGKCVLWGTEYFPIMDWLCQYYLGVLPGCPRTADDPLATLERSPGATLRRSWVTEKVWVTGESDHSWRKETPFVFGQRARRRRWPRSPSRWAHQPEAKKEGSRF